MKKDLSPHDISLINESKGTNKSRHSTNFADKSAQPLAAANTSPTAISANASPHTDTPGTSLSIVDYIRGSGNKAEIVSQSKRPECYQATIFDYTTSDNTTTWVPLYGDEGVEAEITVNILGEKSIILARFDHISSAPNCENGRYYAEVRSLKEFKAWFQSILREEQS